MTTKVCKCGCTVLVKIPTQGVKICNKCKARIVWVKGEDQKPYWS